MNSKLRSIRNWRITRIVGGRLSYIHVIDQFSIHEKIDGLQRFISVINEIRFKNAFRVRMAYSSHKLSPILWYVLLARRGHMKTSKTRQLISRVIPRNKFRCRSSILWNIK